jgi:hypothetical protein
VTLPCRSNVFLSVGQDVPQIQELKYSCCTGEKKNFFNASLR